MSQVVFRFNFFAFLSVFLVSQTVLCLPVVHFEDLREEDIDGLEDFIGSIDPDIRDVVLDLLDAKEIPSEELAKKQMRKIMRTQDPANVEKIYRLFLETLPE